MKTFFNPDAWQELYYSIRKNKLRTALTLIGVSWGMFLYIFLLGLAKGMENGFNKEFDGLASNSFFVWGQQTSEPYEGFPRGRQIQLSLDDVSYLQQKVEGIKQIIPRNVLGLFGTKPSPIIHGIKKGTFRVYGDYPALNQLQKIDLQKGRFINQKDIDEKRKIVVIGKRVVEELFEKDEEPIGAYVQISGIYFQVVGVFQGKQNGFIRDDSVFMPFLTFQEIYNQGKQIGWLAITANDNIEIVELEQNVKSLLKQKHEVAPDDSEAFGSFNLGEMFGKITGFLTGMQLLTLSVGILTILAGVIAISNILLITVKERTKEIGIRRALGAKPYEIRSQVLLESTVLTLFAGCSGFIIATYLLSVLAKIPVELGSFSFWIAERFGILFILCSLGIMVCFIITRFKIIKKIPNLKTTFYILALVLMVIQIHCVLIWMISNVQPDEFPFYNPTVNFESIIIALSTMIGLGLLIGLIPAQRAVMIKPIEALRSE